MIQEIRLSPQQVEDAIRAYVSQHWGRTPLGVQFEIQTRHEGFGAMCQSRHSVRGCICHCEAPCEAEGRPPLRLLR